MFFSLSLVIVGCSNHNVQEYQGFSAKITDIRVAKHELEVIDVRVENKSNQNVEIKTTAMGSNGVMYMAFDKKSYDNSGERTTIGLNMIILNPNDQLALTWIPFSRNKDESKKVSSLIISIDIEGVEKSLTLN